MRWREGPLLRQGFGNKPSRRKGRKLPRLVLSASNGFLKQLPEHSGFLIVCSLVVSERGNATTLGHIIVSIDTEFIQRE